jgi:4-hydroxyphenylpyruvate dioxygenase
MRRAVATVSLSGSLRDKLEAIAAAGFDAIELFENDFVTSAAPATELRAMCADLGLGIDLYQPFRDFEGMPDELHVKNLVRAERKFDLMQQLGAPLMLVCSNTSPASLGDAARAASQLHELAERAARRGLRVGFEALAWGRHVKLYGQAWRIVEMAAHPQLGLVLDSFHTLSLKDDPTAIARIPGDKIFFVQMADAPLLAMDVLQWARHFRNFPGQGQFDVVGFVTQVLRSGYSGTLSLEIFNDVFRETPNRRTAVDAMRSLLWLESEARSRLAPGDGRAPAAPVHVELADIPAATTLGGFAFVEFGVDDETARALEQVLSQLGFVPAGRHRSKRCTLWRQGGLRFVINAEPGSDARARFAEQGAVVSAVGLHTDDAVRAVARAAALLSAPFESPLGAGELHLPAFRSPGGMLLHFIPAAHGADGFAEVDFIAEAAADTAGVELGLTNIDHLALALTADQLDTWVLFSRAVLALEVGDSIDLPDPFGLVRTSSVATADRSVRLLLNVSQSRRTGTARTVALHGGKPAVHNIAIACQDIFAAVARLRQRGFAFVDVSPNVYDDLVARFDLAPALAQKMRQLGVLYDRNADGEYFHAYGRPFAGRFSFELVQRQGYDGYGALNSAARMAAQAQMPPGPQQNWNHLL